MFWNCNMNTVSALDTGEKSSQIFVRLFVFTAGRLFLHSLTPCGVLSFAHSLTHSLFDLLKPELIGSKQLNKKYLSTYALKYLSKLRRNNTYNDDCVSVDLLMQPGFFFSFWKSIFTWIFIWFCLLAIFLVNEDVYKLITFDDLSAIACIALPFSSLSLLFVQFILLIIVVYKMYRSYFSLPFRDCL